MKRIFPFLFTFLLLCLTGCTASHDPEKLRILEAYYTSGAWREDYEADERGELPSDLKRGILSQDALYDLLEDGKRK